jgi:Fe2+ or Zn2+ uptake regulation protein
MKAEALKPNISDLMDMSVRKVVEFMLENRAFDYSKEEIAKGSGISRPTLYRIWPLLERNGLLQETRKYGKTRLYKINETNELVKVLIRLEIAAVKEQFKQMEKSGSGDNTILLGKIHKKLKQKVGIPTL